MNSYSLYLPADIFYKRSFSFILLSNDFEFKDYNVCFKLKISNEKLLFTRLSSYTSFRTCLSLFYNKSFSAFQFSSDLSIYYFNSFRILSSYRGELIGLLFKPSISDLRISISCKRSFSFCFASIAFDLNYCYFFM